MSADALREYHESTKHSFESIRSRGHGLDWGNAPHPLKRYLDIEPEPLPRFRATGVPAHDAVQASATPEGEEAVTAENLSHLLFQAAGVVRTVRTGAGPLYFRTYACAGALYPAEVYVAAGDVQGLGPGVFHYGPAEHALRRLRSADLRGNLGLAGASPGAVTLAFTGIPWRTAWKYTARGFRHLYWDAGMMLANLLAAAASQGIRARLFLGFVDRAVNDLFGLDGRSEFAIALVSLGHGEAPDPKDLPPLDVRTAPISPRPLEDSEILSARDALSFDDEEAVLAFRSATEREDEEAELLVEPFEVPTFAPQGLSSDTLEEVIARRGSSRNLAPESVPAGELAAILDRGLVGLPADWQGARPEIFLAANGLEGIPEGAYRYERGGRFHPIREGSFRRKAGFICLEQPLGSDAAATMFLMADLDAALHSLGGRGYAAAQLGAAVAAGRLYLGAYAQCLGASGITFYDDEASKFFETEREPMLAVVMGPEGRRSSIRRCRAEKAEALIAAGPAGSG
jgi:SagB-type dehydrogenase family enzyme